MEKLISKASSPPPIPSAPLLRKYNTASQLVPVAVAASDRSAPPARQRRIQDSDDDDDAPVFRNAGAAALHAPQPKLAQALPSKEDDDIVLLSQSVIQAAHSPAAAPLSVAAFGPPADRNVIDRNPVLQAPPSVAVPRQRRIQDSDDDDGNVPVVKTTDSGASRLHQTLTHAAESSHAASAPSAAVPVAVARAVDGGAAAARPKLKGLGSLVRRWSSF